MSVRDVPVQAIIIQAGAIGLGAFVELDISSKDFDVRDRGRAASLALRDPTIDLQQDAWFINANTGSDDAAGTTSATALKSFAELRRRWSVGGAINPASGTCTVTLETDLPATDGIALRYLSLKGYSVLVFQGATTTVRTGTLTAVTAVNRNAGASAPWIIEDTGMAGTWTDDLGRRVRMTSGAAIGATFWVAKDLGSSQAWISAPLVNPTVGTGSYTGTLATPQVGDTYIVEDLSAATFEDESVGGDYGSGFPLIYFVGLDLEGTANLPLIGLDVSTFFQSCRWRAQPIPGPNQTIAFINCSCENGLYAQSGSWCVFESGLIRCLAFANETTAATGAILQLDGDALLVGCPLLANMGQLQVGTCGVFDVPAGTPQDISNAGVSIGEHAFGQSSLQLSTYNHATHALYGSGNLGPGIAIGPLGRVAYQTVAPVITGSGGDFTLAGASTARAWDETAGAGAGAYTGLLACTWALFGTTIASGGFGGNAHNVERNCSIVQS